MSLDTWKKEFYPINAVDVFVEDAVAHSLKKWIGLRPENLEKHNVAVYVNAVVNNIIDSQDYVLFIDDSSCALCVHHLDTIAEIPDCKTCPLYKQLDNHSCDDENQPYTTWRTSKHPEPMVQALTKIVINRIEDKEFD